MKPEGIAAGLILSVLLLACCTSTETISTTTTSEAVATTAPAAIETTTMPIATSTTTHKSTTSTASTTTLQPLAKNITSAECYAKGYYWCAGKCSRNECGKCSGYKRCVTLNESSVKVETAEEVSGRDGSCEYSGSYANAGGREGYCDRNEGTLIYAKCGIDSPNPLDCRKALSLNQTTHAPYTARSFHSASGPEYDLWCFRCDAVT